MQKNDLANPLSVVNESEGEIAAFLKEDLLSPVSSVFYYWETNNKFPKLRKLAAKCLCVATVFSETLFSIAGLIYVTEKVRMLVFLTIYNL